MLAEALPDTLELLVRACMEALRLAGDRARKYVVRAKTTRISGRASGSWPSRGASNLAMPSAPASISELELARAVMMDCVHVAQLAPECFHEVVARVARKAEPESYALLFPLYLVCSGSGASDSVSANGAESLAREGEGEGNGGDRASSPGRWMHPTHLFDQCVSAGRLTTAAWYLPLVRDDVAYDAAQR